MLIQPKVGVLDGKDEAILLDDVYNTVVAKANQDGIDEIRIPKQIVLLASNVQPFRRNPKGLLIRKDIDKGYLEEIDVAYERLARETPSR